MTTSVVKATPEAEWLTVLQERAAAVQSWGSELQAAGVESSAGWRRPAAVPATLAECADVLLVVREVIVEFEQQPESWWVRRGLCAARAGIEETGWIAGDAARRGLPDAAGTDVPAGAAAAGFSRALDAFAQALTEAMHAARSRPVDDAAAEAHLRGVARALPRALWGVGEVVWAAGLAIEECRPHEQIVTVELGRGSLWVACGMLDFLVARRGKPDPASVPPRASSDVVKAVRQCMREAREALIAQAARAAADVQTRQRTGSAEMATVLGLVLRSIEAMLRDLMRAGHVRFGGARMQRLEVARSVVAEAGIVLSLSAWTRTWRDVPRTDASGMQVGGPADIERFDAVKRLASTLNDGSARAFGAAVAALDCEALASVLPELAQLLEATESVMLVVATCGAGPEGERADAELVRIAERVRPAVEALLLAATSAPEEVRTRWPGWLRRLAPGRRGRAVGRGPAGGGATR